MRHDQHDTIAVPVIALRRKRIHVRTQVLTDPALVARREYMNP